MFGDDEQLHDGSLATTIPGPIIVGSECLQYGD